MAQETINQLIEGNKKFKEKFFSADNTLFKELVMHGQKPKTMVIACSDSRVDPAMIFNCQPGELFVVRNIANLIPPCEDTNTYHGTSAALEFAVRFLEVEQVIVFGHTQCGGIQALVEGAQKALNPQSPSFIAKWMQLAKPAYEKVMQEHRTASLPEQAALCSHYALVNSLHNMHTFPWIQERVQNGSLTLHAWYFDLMTGGIHRYDQTRSCWILS